MDELNVDEDVADVLAREGFSSIDEVAYCSMDEFSSIDDFDEDLKRGWDRNKTLIDFNCIPKEINDDILNQYNEEKEKYPRWQLALQRSFVMRAQHSP